MNNLLHIINMHFFINTAYAVNGQFYLHGPSWQEKVNVEGSFFVENVEIVHLLKSLKFFVINQKFYNTKN